MRPRAMLLSVMIFAIIYFLGVLIFGVGPIYNRLDRIIVEGTEIDLAETEKAEGAQENTESLLEMDKGLKESSK